MKEKFLDIYNERMELIGKKTRQDVHQGGDWHKCFHCWILHKDALDREYVLFQLRSKTKDVLPNSLDISAAGHLESGETPMDGLRELKEELGIDILKNELIFLGIHVEVYCDKKVINREFDYVYFLPYNKEPSEYNVQPDEVSGLTKVLINDGISLFTKSVASIEAESVVFSSNGIPSGNPYKSKLTIDNFAGGERNNYFIKIFLLAQSYFKGDKLLYI